MKYNVFLLLIFYFVLTFPPPSSLLLLIFGFCCVGKAVFVRPQAKTFFTAALFSHTPQWLTSGRTVVCFSHFGDHCDSTWFSPSADFDTRPTSVGLDNKITKQPLLTNTDSISKW